MRVLLIYKCRWVLTILPVTSELLGSEFAITASNGDELKDELDIFIKAPLRASTRISRSPLIQSIKIKCNSPWLLYGLVLRDIPGTNDPDARRNKLALDFMRDVDHVWLATRANRSASSREAQGTCLYPRQNLVCDNT